MNLLIVNLQVKHQKESKPSNTTSKQPDTNEPSNVDAPKLTESPKATTVHNQPGSTQPVSSNTTSEQPNVEKNLIIIHKDLQKVLKQQLLIIH